METAVVVIFIVLAVLAFAAVAQQAYLLFKRVKAEKQKEGTVEKEVSVLEIMQNGKKVYIECDGIEDESGEVTESDGKGGKA